MAYKGYTFAKSGGYQNLIVNGVGDDRPLMLVGAAVNAAAVACVLLLALPLVLGLRPTTWRRPRPGPRRRGRARGRPVAGGAHPHCGSDVLRAAAHRRLEPHPRDEVRPGDAAPQDPNPSFDEASGSRTDTLFGHRLDQMETRYDAAAWAWEEDAEPTVPLLFDEGLLQPLR